jgi:lipooligosaccharide transport system permease protein
MVVTALAPGVYGRIDASVRRAGAVTGRNVTALRSAYWVLLASGFAEPLLYLMAIGFGLGTYIGDVHIDTGQVVSYPRFVAPAMLAASAMSGALSEATFNFFGKMKHMKLYDAIVATPVRSMEIAFGELMWAMFRGAVYSAAFLAIMVVKHLTTPGWAVLAFAATLLVGFTFGGVGMAITTYMKGWQDFDLIATIQVALFLFSGTFTPLSVYHQPWVRALVSLSPLYQAVALTRSLTLGQPTPADLVHVAYLVALAAFGLWLASRRMANQLLK